MEKVRHTIHYLVDGCISLSLHVDVWPNTYGLGIVQKVWDEHNIGGIRLVSPRPISHKGCPLAPINPEPPVPLIV